MSTDTQLPDLVPLPRMTHYGGTAVVMSAEEIRARDAEVARAAVAAALAAREGEVVATVGSMPGVRGFGIAVFELSEVPLGTKLYTHPAPAPTQATQDAEQAAIPSAQPAPEAAPIACFGLSVQQIDNLRTNGLKPEEIAGGPDTQLDRVRELVWWFARLAEGNANPKWLRSHAFELAYYIACMDVKRQIDLGPIRQAAFLQGMQVTPEERRVLERFGAIPPAAPAATQTAGEEAFDVTLNEDAVELLNVFSCRVPGDEWPELRLQLGNGHSGYGLYLSLAEYPEEGAELLASIPPTAARAAQAGDGKA